MANQTMSSESYKNQIIVLKSHLETKEAELQGL